MPLSITDSVLAFLSGAILMLGGGAPSAIRSGLAIAYSAALSQASDPFEINSRRKCRFPNKPNAPSGAGLGDFGLERLGFGGGGIGGLIGPVQWLAEKFDIAMPPAVASSLRLAVRNAKAAPKGGFR